MSPRAEEVQVTDNWRKMLGLPSYAVCTRCGAATDKDGMAVHDKWHDGIDALAHGVTQSLSHVAMNSPLGGSI